MLFAGCAAKPAETPKPRTESDVRKLLGDEQSRRALEEVRDPIVRESLARHFRERARDAAKRNRKVAIERALVSENIGIGNGLALIRAFVLFHEYDDADFATFLNATEHVGGRVRLALDARVGGLGERLATIELVELDRALLRVSVYKDKDERCCPSELGRMRYGLRGLTLEVLE